MKLFLFLFLIAACGKNVGRLPRDFVVPEKPEAQLDTVGAENNFRTILQGQEKALMEMKEQRGLFQMKEMVTDVAVARTGLLGLSALRSNAGVEIKWARRTLQVDPPTETSDLVIRETTGIQEASDAIADLIAAGKIKVTPKLRRSIFQSLRQVDELVAEAGAASLGKWDFKAVRFDLNISAKGEIFFFAKAGPNLRLRLEWNRRPSAQKSDSPGHRFILKTLRALDQVSLESRLPGFNVRQVSVGVGTTHNGNWGLWKYSSGFIGFLIFTPSASNRQKEASLPVAEAPFLLGGGTEKTTDLLTLAANKFIQGLEKSLQTASFFAEAASSFKGEWYVKEIKTVNDISSTGVFGLADYTTRGALEIDLKRTNE